MTWMGEVSSYDRVPPPESEFWWEEGLERLLGGPELPLMCLRHKRKHGEWPDEVGYPVPIRQPGDTLPASTVQQVDVFGERLVLRVKPFLVRAGGEEEFYRLRSVAVL